MSAYIIEGKIADGDEMDHVKVHAKSDFQCGRDNSIITKNLCKQHIKCLTE